MVIDPTLHPETASHRGVVAWQWPGPAAVLSSASVGGGLQRLDWLVNIGVLLPYERTDLAAHVSEVAHELGLIGVGGGLFTAADVNRLQRASCDGVLVHATVGISKPTWAADATGGYTAWEPGTINLVIQLPVALEPGAAVNAVVTATEAKTQALQDCGIPGTGTASDAVVIVWPSGGVAEPFAGPRSAWGSRVAMATHEAVLSGCRGWQP